MRTRLILAVAFAFPLAAQTDAGKAWAKHVAAATYPLAEAIRKGQQEVADGVAFKAELELDEGVLVYSIDYAQGTKTVNVVLDAKDGKVVEKDTEDGDETALVRACKVPLAAAIATATGAGARHALEATMRLVDGKPFVDVKVLDGTATAIVRVDALSARAAAAPAGPAAQGGEKQWTDVFHTEPAEFRSTGRSTFMILEPGYKLYLQGKEGSRTIDLVISVLAETKVVDGVETRVVEERESADGKLVEVSRNYFAISARTSCVYYFGEDVDMYADGKVVSHEGAWHSGEQGARFGMFLPGAPLLGARFYQEIAPEVAMDRAEITGLDETVETPLGKFTRVLKYEETTPLEKAREHKWFAPGVGLIQDAELKLVRIEK